MTKHINRELAKLVEEKGFDKKCDVYVPINSPDKSAYEFTKEDWDSLEYLDEPIHMPYEHFTFINAPTITEVVDWIYKKHKIWIIVDAGVNGFYGHYKINPIGTLSSQVEQGWTNTEEFPFKEPKEAYEAAIKYVLNNLIKLP